MNSEMRGKDHPTSKPTISRLLTAGKIDRPVVLFLLLLSLFFPMLVQASFQPGNQRLVNADFEAGNMNYWARWGNGIAAVENCCGQHDTPYWGYGRSDVDTWDGYIQPEGQAVALQQNVSWTIGQKYRLSTWGFTNGMTGLVRWWSSSEGGQICGRITSNWSIMPVWCEFTAQANQGNIQVTGNAGSGLWVVSDDWALTPIVQAPRLSAMPKWTNRPVKYYIDWYVTRADMAAASWNNSTGLSLLTRTGDINQAKIRFNVQDFGPTTWSAITHFPDANGIVVIDVNKYHLGPWNNFAYGLDARQSTLAHEFGHALGLADMTTNCQLMNGNDLARSWYCAVFTPMSGDVDGMRAIYP